jgi:VIT1/CCC1 family predicted Fe2+/Mn2+ transporter
VLGFANLFADGFSMGVSTLAAMRAESARSRQVAREQRRIVDLLPEAGRKAIREHYALKGFEGRDLDRVVEVITSDPERWIEELQREVAGPPAPPSAAGRAACWTFVAFVAVGALPLLPYVLAAVSNQPGRWAIVSSALLTSLAFLGTGWWKARVSDDRRWRSAVETLLLGGSAALIAYLVGRLLRGVA